MPWTPKVEREPFPAWEPVPLELPLDDPSRHTPQPVGSEPHDEDDAPRRRVVIIDLTGDQEAGDEEPAAGLVGGLLEVNLA